MNDIVKRRPNARVKLDYGCDGRDMRYYIEYRCPVCNNWIMGYKQENSCDKCGAYFDWGNREPKIVVTRSVEWE